MEKLERFNRSRAAAGLVLAGIFLLAFYCTHVTDLVADDYRYCFSYADDSRISPFRRSSPPWRRTGRR